MRWTNISKIFEIQWKALKDHKKEQDPEVPKITKSLPIIKWTKAFYDYLYRIIGVYTIPLAYIMRTNAQVAMPAPPLMVGQPHSEEHGSIESGMVAHASHDHPSYRDDNSEVYFKLEEATCGTNYTASIKPFLHAKDSCGVFNTLTASMLEGTSGRQRTGTRMTYFTIGYGKVNQIFLLNGL